jgi:hypothetical protein
MGVIQRRLGYIFFLQARAKTSGLRSGTFFSRLEPRVREVAKARGGMVRTHPAWFYVREPLTDVAVGAVGSIVHEVPFGFLDQLSKEVAGTTVVVRFTNHFVLPSMED